MSKTEHFNSTMVRLKGSSKTVEYTYDDNFNSTMVRLKGYTHMITPYSPEFQFHYGTIKSILKSAGANTASSFQFHYGTIKSRIANSHV